MSTYLRMRELASVAPAAGKEGRKGRLPVSQATIWRWTKNGQFPKPVKLSNGVTAWPTEVVARWEAEHAEAVA